MTLTKTAFLHVYNGNAVSCRNKTSGHFEARC